MEILRECGGLWVSVMLVCSGHACTDWSVLCSVHCVVLVRGVSRGVNHVRVGDHVCVPPPPLDRHSVSYILSLRNVHVILAPTQRD